VVVRWDFGGAEFFQKTGDLREARSGNFAKAEKKGQA
jgi:hypothetical protein